MYISTHSGGEFSSLHTLSIMSLLLLLLLLLPKCVHLVSTLWPSSSLTPPCAEVPSSCISSPHPTTTCPYSTALVFFLQGSGAEDRRRTLTPLALRYSILSESTLGTDLPGVLWAHTLPRGSSGLSPVPSTYPDRNSMGTQWIQASVNASQ